MVSFLNVFNASTTEPKGLFESYAEAQGKNQARKIYSNQQAVIDTNTQSSIDSQLTACKLGACQYLMITGLVLVTMKTMYRELHQIDNKCIKFDIDFLNFFNSKIKVYPSNIPIKSLGVLFTISMALEFTVSIYKAKSIYHKTIAKQLQNAICKVD